MKLHYMGTFNGDVDSLPKGEHKPGAVMFKEPDNMDKFTVISTMISMSILVVTFFIAMLRAGKTVANFWGCILTLVCLIPHEFLHAFCFKGDVFMYNNMKQGSLFVVGPEPMTKFRFCFMSLLPSIVFGFIPYIIFLINPSQELLGTFGMLSLTTAAGDFMNVHSAITQMPKGSKTYIHGMNSYWYMPEDEKGKEVVKEK